LAGTFPCSWAHVIGGWRLSAPHRLASFSTNSGLLRNGLQQWGSSASHSSRGYCQPRAVSNCLRPISNFTQLASLSLRLIGFKVNVTLRLAVYRQSVLLGAKPRETHDQRCVCVCFFLPRNPCRHSPYVTFPLTRRWVCLLRICLAFRQVYVSHTWRVIENSSFCTIYESSVNAAFATQSCLSYVSYATTEAYSLERSKLDHRKFEPLIFSVSGFALYYAGNMFILIILCDFCLLPAQFFYIVYITEG
jgi:hypothetical protein